MQEVRSCSMRRSRESVSSMAISTGSPSGTSSATISFTRTRLRFPGAPPLWRGTTGRAARRRGWKSTATPPTGAGRPAPPTATAAPTPPSSRSRCAPAVPGGLTLDAFTINEDKDTVTCPSGITRQMSQNRAVTFGAACASCPPQARYTTARNGRPMTIHQNEGLLRRPRPGSHTAVQAGLPGQIGNRAQAVRPPTISGSLRGLLGGDGYRWPQYDHSASYRP